MGLAIIVTVLDCQTKLFKAEKWQLSKPTTTLTYPSKFSPYRSGWGFEIIITHQLVQGLWLGVVGAIGANQKQKTPFLVRKATIFGNLRAKNGRSLGVQP